MQYGGQGREHHYLTTGHIINQGSHHYEMRYNFTHRLFGLEMVRVERDNFQYKKMIGNKDASHCSTTQVVRNFYKAAISRKKRNG